MRNSRSQWPRGPRRRSAAACLPRLWVRIPPRTWMSVVSVVCCQVEVSATSWSLVQESCRLWCVVVCDLETSWMRRPWPTGGCRAKLERRWETTGRLTSAIIGEVSVSMDQLQFTNEEKLQRNMNTRLPSVHTGSLRTAVLTIVGKWQWNTKLTVKDRLELKIHDTSEIIYFIQVL